MEVASDRSTRGSQDKLDIRHPLPHLQQALLSFPNRFQPLLQVPHTAYIRPIISTDYAVLVHGRKYKSAIIEFNLVWCNSQMSRAGFYNAA